MRELLEVERLARAIMTESHTVTGECHATCRGSTRCGAKVKTAAACPKCAHAFVVEATCDSDVECERTCFNEPEFLVDTDDLFRDLRLALVQLDMARERENNRKNPLMLEDAR